MLNLSERAQQLHNRLASAGATVVNSFDHAVAITETELHKVYNEAMQETLDALAKIQAVPAQLKNEASLHPIILFGLGTVIGATFMVLVAVMAGVK